MTDIGYKTPAEILNYTYDQWPALIGADPIAASIWIKESADITIGASSFDATAGTTSVIISGGICTSLTAQVYNLINRITTVSGLVLESSFRLYVRKYNFS